mgnify:CR=1 FL=1
MHACCELSTVHGSLPSNAGDMVDAMAQGTDALRVAHRGLDADSVGRTMDELQEAMEMNQEVSDAMSMPLPGQIDDVS